MNAAEIARALRGFRASGWWRAQCPVHHSHQTSLALRDGDRALIVKCHAGCPPTQILAELRRLGLFNGTFTPRSKEHAEHDARRRGRNLAIARDIWRRARPGPGSPIERWFEVRQINLPVPSRLRWAPSCRHPKGGSWPAMIACVDNIDGEVIGIRRTYLLADGSGKAPVPTGDERASLGPVAGGAVRLTPLAGDHLLIGEGIETCLSALEATGLPTWAAGDTSGLKNIILPAAVRLVTIIADSDPPGRAAARFAAQRFLGAGREVRIAWPPEGCDFNNQISIMGAVDAR